MRYTMRKALFALATAAALVATTGMASAADGCSPTYDGGIYCLPGARPGVPYYYGGDGSYGGTSYKGPDYPPRDYDPGAAITCGDGGVALAWVAHLGRDPHRKALPDPWIRTRAW